MLLEQNPQMHEHCHLHLLFFDPIKVVSCLVPRFNFTTHVDPVSPPAGIHRIVRRIHYAIFVPTMATDVYLVEAPGTAPGSAMLILLRSSVLLLFIKPFHGKSNNYLGTRFN